MAVKLLDPRKRKYRVSFWYRKRHYAWRVHGNRKLAEDYEAKKRLELAEGNYFPARKSKSLTFTEAADRFLAEYAKHKPSWDMFYYSSESAKKFFGSRLVTEITPEDVRQYRNSERERGLNPVSVNHRQKNLRKLFYWLAELGLFKGDNPASGRRVPLENERPYWRRNFLTQEQFQRLLAVADPKIRLIVMTASYTGMRHGEIRGIRKKDVDLDKCLIHIPKSKNGEPGYVHITETLFKALEPIVRTLPDAESKVIDFTNYDRLWTHAKKAAGLPELHLHDLRHTFASHAIMGSKDTYAVQHLLRLKTPGLMQRYAHLMQGHLRQAALTLDKQLPPANPHPGNPSMPEMAITNPNITTEPTITNC